MIFSGGKCDVFTVSAVHKRFGVEDDFTEGAFRPIIKENEEDLGFSRNWILLAQGRTAPGGSSIVQIVALPSFAYDEDEDDVVRPLYYLTAFIELPGGCICKEVFFYGDDGNSSLSVVRDVSDPLEVSNAEGRQSIGILAEVPQDNETRSAEELWILKYDKLNFMVVAFQSQAEKIEFEGMKKTDSVAKIVFAD